jgi:hypothetical protein
MNRRKDFHANSASLKTAATPTLSITNPPAQSRETGEMGAIDGKQSHLDRLVVYF